MYEFALFLHLLGVALIFSGGAVATVADMLARRRTRPSEIALVLAGARIGALILMIGLVLGVGSGFWLVDELGLDAGVRWLELSFLALGVSAVLGAAGGRAPRHARTLASELAAAGDEPSPELDELVHNRFAAALNILSGLAMLAVVALMVWKPR